MGTKPQNEKEMLALVKKQENSRMDTIELLHIIDAMHVSHAVQAGLLKVEGANISITEAGQAELDK